MDITIDTNCVYGLAHETLATLASDRVTGEIVLRPSLAESWEEYNTTHIKFKLREGVISHAGNEITS